MGKNASRPSLPNHVHPQYFKDHIRSLITTIIIFIRSTRTTSKWPQNGSFGPSFQGHLVLLSNYQVLLAIFCLSSNAHIKFTCLPCLHQNLSMFFVLVHLNASPILSSHVINLQCACLLVTMCILHVIILCHPCPWPQLIVLCH